VPVVDVAQGKLVLNLPADFFEVPEQEPETEEELREASR
jgi:hypothetical protein